MYIGILPSIKMNDELHFLLMSLIDKLMHRLYLVSFLSNFFCDLSFRLCLVSFSFRLHVCAFIIIFLT